MTTKYKTKAFVFGKNNVNEADRVFSVFTDEFGRLDIFGKSIRKSVSKLRSGMDIFFLSEIEFVQGKNRKTLTDAVVINKFVNVSQDLESFKISGMIGEILDSFIKGEEKDEKVFTLINEVMEKLSENDLMFKTKPLIFHYFLWNFFSIQGYRSEVQKCARCGNKLNPLCVYFSSKEGGTICEKCLDVEAQPFGQTKKINSDIVKILRLIHSKDWDILSKLKVDFSSQNLLKEVSESAIRTFCPVHC